MDYRYPGRAINSESSPPLLFPFYLQRYSRDCLPYLPFVPSAPSAPPASYEGVDLIDIHTIVPNNTTPK